MTNKKRKKQIILILVVIFLLLSIKQVIITNCSFIIKNLEMKYFNLMLIEQAKKNIIANPVFFLDKQGKINCQQVELFLSHFTFLVSGKTLLMKKFSSSEVIGIKLIGMLKTKEGSKQITLFLYFCKAFILKADIQKEEDLWVKIFKKEIDGVEVVGSNGYYEIYGNFWWERDGKFFSKILTIVLSPLKEYRVTSQITEKTFILKVSDFPSVLNDAKINIMRYKFCKYFREVFDLF